MNRYKYLFILCLVSGMLLSVTSCEDKSSLIGQGVSFKVTSTSAATKAAYSNSFYDEGSQKYERIDWKVGDKIAIFSPEVSKPENKSSVFTVVDVKNEDTRRSKASVTSSNDMFWGEAVFHHFYAVYPSPETDGLSVTTSLADNSVSGNIPSDQSNYLSNGTGKDSNGDAVTIELVPDLKRYMMMAGMTSTEPTPDPIDIDFSPLTTCIDFTIKNDTGAPLDIKRIALSSSSSEAYSGGFTYKFSNKSFTKGSADNSVSMNFPTAGTVSIAKDETLRFKFFLNPCNDIKNPVFTIVDHNGVKRETTIKPKDGVFEIKSGHKKIINGLLIPESVVWTEMSFKDPMVTEWTVSNEDFGLEPEYTYVLKGLDNLQDVNFEASGGNKTLGPIVSYKIKYDDKDTKIPVVPVVSGAPDWANCSVVKDDTKPDPTYYIDFSNVGQNTTSESHAQKLKAAAPKGTETSPFDLSYYNPATGSTTTTQETANCYVVDAPGYYKFPLKQGNSATTVSAADADVLWQDVSGMVVVDRVADGYIKFHIDATDIQQANALIAGRNKSGGTILWSWHIWVTDEDLTVSPTTSAKIMPVNLGWVADAKATTNVPRSANLTISFTETGGPFKNATKDITVSQDALPNTTTESGTSPYYQWGRKDPFPKYSSFSERVDLDTSIKNPTTLYGRSGYEEWCFGPEEYWKTTKSVYDPCPVGFKVLTKNSALKITSFYDKLPKLGRLIVSGLDLKAESPKYYYWVTGDTNFNSYNSHYSSAAIYDGNCSCTYQTTSICFGFSVRPEFE